MSGGQSTISEHKPRTRSYYNPTTSSPSKYSAVQILDAALAASSRTAIKHVFSMIRKRHINQVLFPTATTYIIEYITDLCKAGLGNSTIVSRISAVSYIHKMPGAEDPSQLFVIHKMLTGIWKLTKRSDVRLPITKVILTDLMGALLHTSESLYTRNTLRAMFSLAFFGFL